MLVGREISPSFKKRAMVRTIKVQALEIDGVELPFPEEVLLSVDNISSNLYGMEGLAEALEFVRMNPDLSKTANFSYKIVDGIKTIPYGQQMLVKGRLTVNGRLIIEGQVCQI